MININECIAKAMKSKNQVELRAYKNLKAEIQILQTAKNAKMDCISVSYGFREKQYLIDNGATVICDNIDQLKDLLLKGK